MRVVIGPDEKELLQAIGLRARTPRPGPEADLVNHFIESGVRQFHPSVHVTVFLEPWLDGGCPDIVIVHWAASAYREWKHERHGLNLSDIRLLHHLFMVGESTKNEVAHTLGLLGARLEASTEALDNAGLIRSRGGRLSALAPERVFGVRRIVAVEAKMSDWAAGLLQACRNRWFASESLVLVPLKEAPEGLKRQAKAWGVGVLGRRGQKFVRFVQPERAAMPCSYVSWLFNEWVGRHLQYTS